MTRSTPCCSPLRSPELDDLRRAARLRHRDVLRAGPLLPAGQRRPHRRHPRRHRRGLHGFGARADPAHQPHRGRRPGRLDDRRADGVPQAVGAPRAQPICSCDRRSCSPVPGRAVHGDALHGGGRARPVRPRVPRPAVQPAPLLHELPRLGDAGRVGRARALRRRVQARRRPRRRLDEERRSTAARDAGGAGAVDRGGRRRASSSSRTTTRRG